MKDPVIESWCATRSIESRADFVRLPVDSANRHRRLWAKKTCPPRGKPRAVKSEQCLGQRSRSRPVCEPRRSVDSKRCWRRSDQAGCPVCGVRLSLCPGGGHRRGVDGRSACLVPRRGYPIASLGPFNAPTKQPLDTRRLR